MCMEIIFLRKFFNTVNYIFLYCLRIVCIIAKLFLVYCLCNIVLRGENGITLFYSQGKTVFYSAICLSALFDVWIALASLQEMIKGKEKSYPFLNTSRFPFHWSSRAKLWASTRYDANFDFYKQNLKTYDTNSKVKWPDHNFLYCRNCGAVYDIYTKHKKCANCEYDFSEDLEHKRILKKEYEEEQVKLIMYYAEKRKNYRRMRDQ